MESLDLDCPWCNQEMRRDRGTLICEWCGHTEPHPVEIMTYRMWP